MYFVPSSPCLYATTVNSHVLSEVSSVFSARINQYYHLPLHEQELLSHYGPRASPMH